MDETKIGNLTNEQYELIHSFTFPELYLTKEKAKEDFYKIKDFFEDSFEKTDKLCKSEWEKIYVRSSVLAYYVSGVFDYLDKSGRDPVMVDCANSALMAELCRFLVRVGNKSFYQMNKEELKKGQ